MNRNNKTVVRGLIISIFICLFASVSTFAAEYDALAGLNDIKAVFDVVDR